MSFDTTKLAPDPPTTAPGLWAQPMSPFRLKILLHYYCMPGDVDRLDNEAVKAACEEFVTLGLLARGTSCEQYSGQTKAMNLYIDTLLAIPLPVQRWVIPEP